MCPHPQQELLISLCLKTQDTWQPPPQHFLKPHHNGRSFNVDLMNYFDHFLLSQESCTVCFPASPFLESPQIMKNMKCQVKKTFLERNSPKAVSEKVVNSLKHYSVRMSAVTQHNREITSVPCWNANILWSIQRQAEWRCPIGVVNLISSQNHLLLDWINKKLKRD